MNIPTYAYDDTHVAAADSGGGGRKFLDDSGPYVGAITYALAVQSSNGGWGVEFGFTADDGRKTKYPLTLWTLGPDGRRYFGHNLLECLLICAGMKAGMALKPGRVTYLKWDYDLRAEVEMEGDGYPGMTGKRIGLILQREIYTNKKGNDAVSHAIVGAFDPETRQAASEKIANKPAELTAKRCAELKDKDSRAVQSTMGYDNNGFTSRAAPTAAVAALADLEDDIPF